MIGTFPAFDVPCVYIENPAKSRHSARVDWHPIEGHPLRPVGPVNPAIIPPGDRIGVFLNDGATITIGVHAETE